MPSGREAALNALFARLQTLAAPTVLRNEVLLAKIPAGGLVIVRAIDSGEPEAAGEAALPERALVRKDHGVGEAEGVTLRSSGVGSVDPAEPDAY